MKKIFVLGLTIMMAISTFMLQGCRDSEAQTPVTNDPTILVNTVGWDDYNQQGTVLKVAKSHIPGDKVVLNPPMDEVISVTYIHEIPSTLSKKQTLIKYRYVDATGTGTNHVLIQGHLEGIKYVESIPDVLNNSNCCYKYGGCIVQHQCNEQQNDTVCVPCSPKPKQKQECQPCRQKNGYTPGKKQGSGATKEVPANGGNRRIINL